MVQLGARARWSKALRRTGPERCSDARRCLRRGGLDAAPPRAKPVVQGAVGPASDVGAPDPGSSAHREPSARPPTTKRASGAPLAECMYGEAVMPIREEDKSALALGHDPRRHCDVVGPRAGRGTTWDAVGRTVRSIRVIYAASRVSPGAIRAMPLERHARADRRRVLAEAQLPVWTLTRRPRRGFWPPDIVRSSALLSVPEPGRSRGRRPISAGS